MDYCRIDLGICGGVNEGKKIAGWCETHYIPLASHSPQGPVSTAASLHLSLATALVGVQELPKAPMSSLVDEFPVQMLLQKWTLADPG